MHYRVKYIDADILQKNFCGFSINLEVTAQEAACNNNKYHNNTVVNLYSDNLDPFFSGLKIDTHTIADRF